MRIAPRIPLALLPTLMLTEFLPWYFVHRPAEIVRAYGAYAKACAEIFSIFFLMKTLVAPWKSIAEQYPDNWMQLGKILQVFTLNCTARSVGAVVRTVMIAIGILVQGILLLGYMAYLAFWITIPLLAVLGIELVVLSFRFA